MNTKKVLVIIGMFLFLYGNIYPQFILQGVKLDGNNISTYFYNSGIFNQDRSQENTPGFEWPKGSGKFAIFSTGFSIAAKINGTLAESMASYKGEFYPGYVNNGIAYTNSNFKFYKISRGDNANNNPDYANWHLMIPYGAPYIDVNNNHQYDPGVDSIGIKNAAQVVFVCMTDGFDSTHSEGEGFGGGLTEVKLFSQIAWTAWCYDRNDLKDIQFMKWAVINRGLNPWNSTYFSIVADPDLGDANDDYIGCDTALKLAYCYNGDNYDPVYGWQPPAAGIIVHKSPYDLSSINFCTNTSTPSPVCETDPSGQPDGAYLFMRGFKKDSSNFMNPTVTPPVPTFYVYTGEPGVSGWTEFGGSVQNCGGNYGTIISSNPVGDRRFIMSSGKGTYTVNPNDTVVFYASQLIAQSTNNISSVTSLKQLANVAWSVYNGGFSVGVKGISSEVPTKFELFQNYPNPFNPKTNIKYSVSSVQDIKLIVYDILGKEVATLVNQKQVPGLYEVTFDGNNLSSGIYFYKLTAGSFSQTKKMILLK